MSTPNTDTDPPRPTTIPDQLARVRAELEQALAALPAATDAANAASSSNSLAEIEGRAAAARQHPRRREERALVHGARAGPPDGARA